MERVVPNMEDFVKEEITYLAKTIYGESRGENLETQMAVAWVIRNRKEAGGWFGKTYKEVVTKPWQFSCWNKDDPNREKIEHARGAPWFVALGVAIAVYYANPRANPLPGVFHYYDKSLDKNPPKWALTAERVEYPAAPNMRFYKGVK